MTQDRAYYRRLEQLLRRIGSATRREAFRAMVRRAVTAGVSIGSVIGIIEGIWPDPLGESELTPDQVREAEERFRREVERLENINVTRQRQYPEGLGGDIVINVPRRPGGIPPPSWEQLPPSTQSTPDPRRQREPLLVRVRRGIQQNLERIVIGTIGLGTVSALRSRSSSAPLTVNIPQSALGFSSGPQAQPLTVVQGGGVPLSPTAQRTCECKAKRKQKRRKCLERAQVEWRTGRYKGKPAGTRCVRFSGE